MTRQTAIALGIALVLGLLAVYMANAFLTSTQSRADEASAGTARVAVAAVPLAYGVELTPEKVRFVNYPVNSIPPGSFRDIGQLMPEGKARVALLPMQINEPILASKVTGGGQNASISALLPDGKRAAAVRINDVSGVAGFIQPNDTVDVLITRQIQGTGDRSQQLTDVLLQNIRVIAMDQDAQGADGKPSVARTATLELDPVEAQKLALGQQVGQISLVLRKPGEEQNTAVQTVSMSDLRYQLYGPTAVPVQPQRPRASPAAAPRRTVRTTARPVRPAPAPRPTTSSVEVVRGTVGNSYEVGEYGS